MTIYLVDEHHFTHTCPADPQPHVVDIRRTIVHVTPGGPCNNPVTVRSGDTTAVIPCGRHEPYERQCFACRTVVTTGTIITTYLGYQGPVYLAPVQTGAAR